MKATPQPARRRAWVLAAYAAWCAVPLAGAATMDMRNQDIEVTYEDGISDLRNDVHELTRVSIVQGKQSIQADKGVGKGLQSDRSQWTFTDSVHIRTLEVDLKADSANAAISNGQIRNARIAGSPAQFEQRGEQLQHPIRGTAGVIEYDFANGIVKLSDNVWFSDGENEYRIDDAMTYNVRTGHLQTSGPSRQTIRPGSLRAPKGAQATEPPTPSPSSNAESGA